MDEEAKPSTGIDAGKGALVVLFLVTMIDMIGFGIVIPFLTYLVRIWLQIRTLPPSEYGLVF